MSNMPLTKKVEKTVSTFYISAAGRLMTDGLQKCQLIAVSVSQLLLSWAVGVWEEPLYAWRGCD